MYVHCDPNETPQFCNNLRVAIASPLAILGFSNSLLNPIIYAWWHNGFRETAKKIYRQMFCKTTRQKKNDAMHQPHLSPIEEQNTSNLSRTTYLSSTASMTSPTTSDVETSITDYENRVTMPVGGTGETSNRRYRNM
jgi:hypothetical protein